MCKIIQGGIMKKVSLLLIAFTLSFSVAAKDSSSGCGPGWFVFKKNSLVSSALRVTTNGILFPFVTLGMTFGTSNCSKHSIVLKEKESLKFATENYYELAADVAKGEGDFLTAFNETLGCHKDASKFLNQEMKSNYKKIFNEKANPEQLMIQTYNLIFTKENLAKSCLQA